MTYTDWLGQPIEVGTPVLYAVSNGHYAQVVWAEVLEIIPVKPQRRDVYDMEAGRDPVTNRYPVIGQEDYWPYDRKFKLKVQPHYQSEPGTQDRGIEHKTEWSEGDWNDPDPANYPRIVRSWFERVVPKPVTIQNVEKVTVFPLPEGVRERLDAEIEEKIRAGNERLMRARPRA